jgi:hypothetical protein
LLLTSGPRCQRQGDGARGERRPAALGLKGRFGPGKQGCARGWLRLEAAGAAAHRAEECRGGSGPDQRWAKASTGQIGARG